MRKPTLLMGPLRKPTLVGVAAQANKPQNVRLDVWGRVKPIGAYAMVTTTHATQEDAMGKPVKNRG